MTQQDNQIGPRKKAHKHVTTKRGTGSANRKVVKKGRGGTPDPPNPTGKKSRPLDKDPEHSAEFIYKWERDIKGCTGSGKGLKCPIRILSPPGWREHKIVPVHIPELEKLEHGGESTLGFHHLVAAQFKAFFKAVGVKDLKHLLLNNAGSCVFRTITGKPTALSNHALGTAIDINTTWNWIYTPPAPRHTLGSVSELADFCADFGLFWGGWYEGRKDGMHFECVTIQDDAALRGACEKHGFRLEDLELPAELLPQKSK